MVGCFGFGHDWQLVTPHHLNQHHRKQGCEVSARYRIARSLQSVTTYCPAGAKRNQMAPASAACSSRSWPSNAFPQSDQPCGLTGHADFFSGTRNSMTLPG
jgi:hypothetical protein